MVSNGFDKNKPGNYIITYEVVDKLGEKYRFNRKVFVLENPDNLSGDTGSNESDKDGNELSENGPTDGNDLSDSVGVEDNLEGNEGNNSSDQAMSNDLEFSEVGIKDKNVLNENLPQTNGKYSNFAILILSTLVTFLLVLKNKLKKMNN
ncbi:hypothetical protein [Vagococcus xieshaowenii]|uniref:Pesticidal crystal protein Cry22Aa Ig-like domain-containing protein n=1 Tax=Vagococcus xieshaowenii TaxID=2562451 RepID=A0AAJ5EG09_9ENTE|nr:hypothetical protein [Vagococcus xieshaowenii]QCA28864.1 hypothetical protein E4Z98_05845 [Vagococcus xieshaowenii]TFZ43429.1 hypothetical protein E4031_00030 [Vagococcus xieshaowenii]